MKDVIFDDLNFEIQCKWSGQNIFLSFETARPESLAEQNAHRRSTRTATHRTGARLICLTELFCSMIQLYCTDFLWMTLANIEPSKAPKVKRAVPGSSLAESNK